jgi:hypothetical protein
MRAQSEEGAVINIASTDSSFVSLQVVQTVPITACRCGDGDDVTRNTGNNHRYRTNSGSKDSTDSTKNGNGHGRGHEPGLMSKRRRKKRAPTGW